MSKLGKALLAIVFLVAASTPIIAQDSVSVTNQPECVSCASQQDLQKLQKQERITAARARVMKGEIKALNLGQAEQGAQIDSVAGQVANQGTAIKNTDAALGKTNKTLAAMQGCLHHLGWWMAVFLGVAAFILIVVGGLSWMFWRMIKNLPNESIVVNPEILTLRALFEEALVKNPKGDHGIHFTYRLSPNPEKGFLEGGDVKYVAIFDKNHYIGDQYPDVYCDDEKLKREFGDERLKLKDLPKHTAKLLRLKKADVPPELPPTPRPAQAR